MPTGPSRNVQLRLLAVTATASDDDPQPSIVTADATAEVDIVDPTVVPETSMAELLRLFVLFIASTILVGGLGLAVVRRSGV